MTRGHFRLTFVVCIIGTFFTSQWAAGLIHRSKITQPTAPASPPLQPEDQYEAGSPSSLSYCDIIKPGSFHVGDSCLSDCHGDCSGAELLPGFRLIGDSEQVKVKTGCVSGERVVCSPIEGAPGGHALCEELDKTSCGANCKCWSTCTNHVCNAEALVPGFSFDTDENSLSPAGCMIDLERRLCAASVMGGFVQHAQESTSPLLTFLIIVGIVVLAGGIYYFASRKA